MSWAKVDDQWFAHPKVVALSLAARGLWIATLSWSCAQRTDYLPRHMVRFLAGGEDIDPLGKELVESGLWIEDGEGWSIHDWDEYQNMSLSEKRSKAGKKGAEKRWGKEQDANPPENGKSKQTDSNEDLSGVANGMAGAPTRPDPSLEEHVSSADDDTDDLFEQFWTSYPRGRSGKPGGGGAKKPALQKWRRLTEDERSECLAAVDNYRAYVEADDGPYAAHVTTWLNEERWGQWQTPAKSQSTRPPRESCPECGAYAGKCVATCPTRDKVSV